MTGAVQLAVLATAGLLVCISFADFNLPHLHLVSSLRLNFAKIFGIQKLDSLGYHVALSS